LYYWIGRFKKVRPASAAQALDHAFVLFDDRNHDVAVFGRGLAAHLDPSRPRKIPARHAVGLYAQR